jgi:hypothetical protein
MAVVLIAIAIAVTAVAIVFFVSVERARVRKAINVVKAVPWSQHLASTYRYMWRNSHKH